MIGKLSHPASLWEVKVWRKDAGQRFLRTSRTAYQRSSTVHMIITRPRESSVTSECGDLGRLKGAAVSRRAQFW